MTPRTAASSPATHVAVDASDARPLHRQIYDGLRDAILDGRLAAGAQLPSTRLLAEELGVARNTVSLAFDQLRAEGYLSGRQRAGTFVSETLPDRALQVHVDEGRGRSTRVSASSRTRRARANDTEATTSADSPAIGLSRRGERLAQIRVGSPPTTWNAPRAFRPGVPALDAFPWALWSRLGARRLRERPGAHAGYGPSAGHQPLRAAIAEYVSRARAVRCAPEQVLVVSGSQQALDLAARLLLDTGDEAWMEEPGYAGAHGALVAADARIVPVPVDADGLMVSEGERLAPRARLAYVSPSHQYPLGVTMSAARRLALLEWARRAGAWIIEDDYDSEYRYASRPLASLQGMDGDERVLYVGTFSKTLFPALRLGYVIVPPALVDAFCAARATVDRHAPTLAQLVLTDFLEQGHFARHVRRMRSLYEERQRALLDAAARGPLGAELALAPADAGMHLLGWLRDGLSDSDAAHAALEAGVEVSPLSRHAATRQLPDALMLGYAAYTPAIIRRAADQLGRTLAGLRRHAD